MATSDFKADRIRGNRFILSGSSGNEPAFMIYSASVANDLTGGIKSPARGGFIPSTIGEDVFLVVSGTSGSMSRASGNRVRGTMVFIGDVYFSGAMKGNIVTGSDGPIGPRGLQGLTGSAPPSLSLASNALIFSITPSGSVTSNPSSVKLTATYVSQSNAMVLADYKASGSDGTDLSGRFSAFSNTSTTSGGKVTGAASIVFSYNNADRIRYPVFVTASSDTFTESIAIYRVADGTQGPTGSQGVQGIQGVQGLTGSAVPSLDLSSNSLIFSIIPSGSTTSSPTSVKLTATYVSQSNAMVLADYKVSGSDGTDLSGRLSSFSNTSTTSGGKVTGNASVVFTYNNADRTRYPIFVTASSDTFTKTVTIYRVAQGPQGVQGIQGNQGVQGLTGSAPPSLSLSSNALIFSIVPSGSATSNPTSVKITATYVSQSNAMTALDFRVSGSDGTNLSGSRFSAFSNTSTTSGGKVTGEASIVFSYNNADRTRFPIFVTASSDTFSESLTIFRVAEGPQGDQGIQGIQGIQGVQGVTGSQGLTGSAVPSLDLSANALIFAVVPSGSATSNPTSVKITATYVSQSNAMTALDFQVSGSDGTNLSGSRFSAFSNTSTTSGGKVTGEASIVFNYNNADRTRYPVFVTASSDSFTKSVAIYRVTEGPQGDQGIQGIQGVQGPSGGDGIFAVTAGTGFRGETTSSVAFANPVGDADSNTAGFGKGLNVFFYVSGSKNSSMLPGAQAPTGSALFGGDLVVSGTIQALAVPGGMMGDTSLRAAGSITATTSVTASQGGFISFGFQPSSIPGLTGSISRTPTGQPFIAGDSSTSVAYNHTTRQWTIGAVAATLDSAYDGGGAAAGAIINANIHPVQINNTVLADGAQQTLLAVSGVATFGSASAQYSGHMPPLPGLDTSFFVSGSVKPDPADYRGLINTAVFGGDVLYSGSIGGALRASATGSNIEVLRTYSPLHFRAKSNTAVTTTALILDRSGSVSSTKGGTRILFKIPYDNTSVPGAAIEGRKDSASSTQNYGRLSFYTQNSTTKLDEQMRIGYEGVTIRPDYAGTVDAGSAAATLLVHGGSRPRAFMVRKSTGAVGIGLNPSHVLHVSGAAIQLEGPIKAPDGNNATLAKIYNMNGEDDGALDIYEGLAAGSQANIRLTPRSGTPNYISGSGGIALGINTTSPQSALEIVQAKGKSSIVQTGNPARYGLLVRQEDTSTLASAGIALGTQTNNVGASMIFTDKGSFSSGDLSFYVKKSTSSGNNPELVMALSGTKNVTLPGEGRLGIGTTNPSGSLHVSSTGSVSLRLEADTDNSGEFDVPFIKLLGDGGAVRSLIGQSPGTGKAPDGHDVTNAVSNDLLIGTLDSFGVQIFTAGSAAMRVNTLGYVGIGDHTPDTYLDVSGSRSDFLGVFVNDGNNVNKKGLKIQYGDDGGSGTSTAVSFFDGDGTSIGSITSTGGTVTYGPFTGGHYAALPEGVSSYEYGTVVKIHSTFTGSMPRSRQVFYNVSESTSSQDPGVIGVYNTPLSGTGPSEAPHQIFALGDGHVLVCDEGGDISIGDYLCSSNTSGHAMKQSDGILRNYTVAKSTESVTWSDEPGSTKRISCTYHSG